MSKWQLVLGLGLVTTLAACEMELPEDNIGTRVEAAGIPDPLPTLVLFSEGGQWGNSLVTQISPVLSETVRLIPTSQINAAGLGSQISSFRLTCGSRDGAVVLFKEANTGTVLSTWSPYGQGMVMTCHAGQTVNVNLHTLSPSFADRVASVYFVSHAREAVQKIGFSDLFGMIWNAKVDAIGFGGGPDGPVRLQMLSATKFNVLQFVRISIGICETRDARIELEITMNQDNSVHVAVLDESVDSGWGDIYGCQSDMEEYLHDKLAGVVVDMSNDLEDAITVFHTGPRIYFSPNGSLREFLLFTGGNPPPPPPVNR